MFQGYGLVRYKKYKVDIIIPKEHGPSKVQVKITHTCLHPKGMAQQSIGNIKQTLIYPRKAA